MYNDNDLDERWNDFITKLNEARYNDRKTYPGDPTGNYDETGTYNKLGPDEEQATFYSQEDADKKPRFDMGDDSPSLYDLPKNVQDEVERALSDAHEALATGDPADIYDRLKAISDLVDALY